MYNRLQLNKDSTRETEFVIIFFFVHKLVRRPEVDSNWTKIKIITKQAKKKWCHVD